MLGIMLRFLLLGLWVSVGVGWEGGSESCASRLTVRRIPMFGGGSGGGASTAMVIVDCLVGIIFYTRDLVYRLGFSY